ncbi:hypothetical protein WJX73_004553 [Symbiochloris irregularis]|uniref:RNA-binding protein 8A n=1 Tax=Symbiochloris irregularis TaxID=706552 RepID=A0AAW1PU63_9CHLO
MAAYGGDEDMRDVDDAPPKVRSQVVRTQKGRGFRERERDEEPKTSKGAYDRDTSRGPGPAKSVEGWVIFVSNLHEECQEDDLRETFEEYGHIKSDHLNLDRRTGFVKGYALIEYETQQEGQRAIDKMNNQPLLSQPVKVSWCFTKEPGRVPRSRR